MAIELTEDEASYLVDALYDITNAMHTDKEYIKVLSAVQLKAEAEHEELVRYRLKSNGIIK